MEFYRVDVCMITDVSGVHLGQDDFPATEARQLLPEAVIGLSTHNIAQLRDADRLAIDYISIGPIFPTTSKDNPDPVVGIDLLHKAVISEIYKNDDVSNNLQRLSKLFSTQRPEDTMLHE